MALTPGGWRRQGPAAALAGRPRRLARVLLRPVMLECTLRHQCSTASSGQRAAAAVGGRQAAGGSRTRALCSCIKCTAAHKTVQNCH